jgi:outer membrane protein assembly factor BamB
LRRTRRVSGWCVGLAALAIALWIGTQPVRAQTGKEPAKAPDKGTFNEPGNILIADQFNNRVIEVDRKTHAIVWQFGDGKSVAGPKSVVAPNDAERVGDWTLISGTGAPAGAEPSCPNGCPDNRVFLVDRSGKIFWQYGRTGVAGVDFNELDTPVCAVFLPCAHVLITDQGNQRVIEVSIVTKKTVWQYGTTGVAGTKRNQLNSPNSAELLDNGHILIADEGNGRVIEVNREHEIVWQYGEPNHPKILNQPAFASRLLNGNTLIADSGNNRIIEIDKHAHVVLEYATNNRPGSVADPLPTRAVRLENGDTLISDQFNHQVIEIDSKLKIVFTQGTIAVAGIGLNQLNAPYDAKAIGDYTGLTPPFLRSWCEWCEGPDPNCL